VPVSTAAIGKSFPPAVYAVGREKVKEFALAIGERDPLHLDVEAARRAGFPDVVAPPMFVVVYSSSALSPALFDPEVGIDFARMVHGGQRFTWPTLVVAGDEITTHLAVKDINEHDGKGFYVFESTSVNQDGDEVVRGTWTNIVRGV
jgi:acyl dehydratase